MAIGLTDVALAKFSKDMKAFGLTVLPKALVEFHQKVTLQVLQGVVFKTPVDTGLARGGWHVTVNFIDQTPTGVLDPAGGKAPAVEEQSTSTIERGIHAMGGLKPYSVTYVNNNVDYIILLEEGHSEQARPAGSIVALTLEEVRQQFAA